MAEDTEERDPEPAAQADEPEGLESADGEGGADGGAAERDAAEPPAPPFLATLRSRLSGESGPLLAICAALLIGQLILRGAVLGRLYFSQDDFIFQHQAATEGLGWTYLTRIHADHLMPGALLVAWLVERASPLNWGLAALVVIVFQLVASLALLRVLRLLFGMTTATVVLFALYLFNPVTLAGAGWWAAALQVVPLQAALALALGSHIRYVREGGWLHAFAAVAWTAVGLTFIGKAVGIPVLLFGVTALVFTRQPTIMASLWKALRRYWRLWTVYVVLLAGYEILYRARLHADKVNLPFPDSVSTIAGFTWRMVSHTFVTALFGGPWKWGPIPGSTAMAAPPDGLVYLSWLALACVVAVSVTYRVNAGRAWLLLFGYVLIGDVVPVLFGRIGGSPASFAPLLALETRYVADAATVAAVCLGLAFVPLQGETAPWRRPKPSGQRVTGAVSVLATLLVVGLMATVNSFLDSVDASFNKTWITNARAAVQSGTSGTAVLDTWVPPSLVVPWAPGAPNVSSVLAPVETKEQLRDIPNSQPVDNAFAFDDTGRLRPVVGVEHGAKAPPGPINVFGYCFGDASHPYVDINLPADLPWHLWVVRLGYADGDPTSVQIRYGLADRTLQLPAGPHTVTFTLAGNGTLLRLSNVTSHYALCVNSIEIGDPVLG